MSDENADDIGLIEIESPYAKWNSKPPVTGKLVGTADLDYVENGSFILCRSGSTTGLSCGNYVGQQDGGTFNYGNEQAGGDSGGAIYAVNHNGEMWAVGVTSYSSGADKHLKGGMEIWEILEYYKLTVI